MSTTQPSVILVCQGSSGQCLLSNKATFVPTPSLALAQLRAAWEGSVSVRAILARDTLTFWPPEVAASSFRRAWRVLVWAFVRTERAVFAMLTLERRWCYVTDGVLS